MKKVALLLILIIVLSCKTETRKVTDALCDNQKYLLAPNKDLPTFEFDLNINPKEHIQVLKDSLKINDLCGKLLVFNKKVEDRIIELNILAVCNFVGQHFTQELELNINNQILYDHELSTLKNLKKKVNTKFPFYKNRTNKIDIRWEYGLTKPIINDVIYQISEGYLDALERISKEKLKKSICELNNNELKTLKKDFSLTIDLKLISETISDNFELQQLLKEKYNL